MNFIKKLIVTFLTLALISGCIPCAVTEVQAAPKATKSITAYIKPDRWDNKGSCVVYILVNGLQKGQKITSVKVSPKGFLSNLNTARKNKTSAYITCVAKKAGTGTVSYKIGNKQYKTKVTIKKYTNPVKSVSITGLKYENKTNLSSLTNRMTDTKKIELPQTIKNPKLQVTAKKGWEIQQISYRDKLKIRSLDPPLNDYKVIDFKKPVSKADIRIFSKTGELKKGGDGYGVTIRLVNSKDKAYLDLTYYIDLDYREMMYGESMDDPI